MPEIKYKRVLLKLSGEALAGSNKTGIDWDTVENICEEIKKIKTLGAEVAIVVGGGNFWRGAKQEKMDRSSSDYMGMLATAMNGLALQNALEAKGVATVLQTAIEMRQVAEPFVKRNAVNYLENGKVVIFGCGTGSPYFTTDTAASLRAAEIGADAILVGKTIDGVYSADPKVDASAIKYDKITYSDILNKNLKVMDLTAISLCKDNNIKLIVFELAKPENIVKAIKGEEVGTLINE